MMQSGILALFRLILLLGMTAGWIVFLVAIWRGMKAHESIASSLRKLAEKDG